MSSFKYKYYQDFEKSHVNFQAIFDMNFKDHLKFWLSSNLFCSFNYEGTCGCFSYDYTIVEYDTTSLSILNCNPCSVMTQSLELGS